MHDIKFKNDYIKKKEKEKKLYSIYILRYDDINKRLHKKQMLTLLFFIYIYIYIF